TVWTLSPARTRTAATRKARTRPAAQPRAAERSKDWRVGRAGAGSGASMRPLVVRGDEARRAGVARPSEGDDAKRRRMWLERVVFKANWVIWHEDRRKGRGRVSDNDPSEDPLTLGGGWRKVPRTHLGDQPWRKNQTPCSTPRTNWKVRWLPTSPVRSATGATASIRHWTRSWRPSGSAPRPGNPPKGRSWRWRVPACRRRSLPAAAATCAP